MRGDDEGFWTWLEPGVRPSKKNANKFLLASILDYQIKAETAWESARRLSEEFLGDTDDLWEAITACSLDEWNAKWKEYSLHWLSKAHERVYTIGRKLATYYGGDARRIWEDQSIGEVLYRLTELGVGPAISRMVVGALIDTRILSGRGDVKPDVHVRRVLGRLLMGTEFPSDRPEEAVEATRRMCPENPWLLDRGLYVLGKSVCRAKSPKCPECGMRSLCAHANHA